jgi:hypothetical protein
VLSYQSSAGSKRDGAFRTLKFNALSFKGKRIIAGRPVGVGDVEMQLGAVAGRQEFRHARGQNDRVPDDDLGFRLAHGVARPGNRHDASGSVELRDVEADQRLAILADLDDP